jgi:hypothetical protein
MLDELVVMGVKVDLDRMLQEAEEEIEEKIASKLQSTLEKETGWSDDEEL